MWHYSFDAILYLFYVHISVLEGTSFFSGCCS